MVRIFRQHLIRVRLHFPVRFSDSLLEVLQNLTEEFEEVFANEMNLVLGQAIIIVDF